MSEISFIVEKLNQAPFSRNLTLVSFDELSHFELLQLLNDVLAYLDPKLHGVDLRDEIQGPGQEAATANRITDFLRILRYPVPANPEAFKQAIGNGDRAAVYPVLHYILSKLEPMKTRAYLARFLVGVEVPPAFLHDEAIQDVYQHYKGLQKEFKNSHKAVEQLRHNTMQPGELKREISQLEEEKAQLLDKIAQLERKTESMTGFEELYQVTSELRKQQEEEAKVQDQRREQQAALQMSEQRLDEVRERCEELQEAQRDDTPEELLLRLEKEVHETRQKIEHDIPQELQESYDKLSEVERALSEPMKSQSDVDEMENRVRRMQREIDNLQDQVDRSRRLNGGDDKLKMFRQQSAMIAQKLTQKQDELEQVQKEFEQTEKEFNDKERILADLSGPKFMKKHEFREYASSLREKTMEYRKKKAELAALRSETVILNRTETIMRTRGENVEEFLRSVERNNGVEGAGDVEMELESVSKKAAHLNKTKKMTLEEISGIVRELKDTLARRKAKLTPQIQNLRTVREEFKEIEQDYLAKKAIYENTAVGLESERIQLESDCNSYQQECIREESRYHYLNCLSDIADIKLNRVQDELSFQKGEGRLLRDFKTYKDLYNHKIQQQEQLSKELRKRQKVLKENQTDNSHQRQQFVDLKRLLSTKLKVSSSNQGNPAGSQDGVLDLGQDIGGANVMTIQQSMF